MNVETLRAMNENLQANLMMTVEVVVMITVVFAVATLAIYLGGVAWFCFKERRQPKTARQTPGRATLPAHWEVPPRVRYERVRATLAHKLRPDVHAIACHQCAIPKKAVLKPPA